MKQDPEPPELVPFELVRDEPQPAPAPPAPGQIRVFTAGGFLAFVGMAILAVSVVVLAVLLIVPVILVRAVASRFARRTRG